MGKIDVKNMDLYYSSFHALKNINLEIPEKKITAFIGPSGCGKSTILRMIGGMEDITSGEIYLGKDLLNDILPRDRSLAMAFQNYPALFSLKRV
mgnify:CR=1 FL=1